LRIDDEKTTKNPEHCGTREIAKRTNLLKNAIPLRESERGSNQEKLAHLLRF